MFLNFYFRKVWERFINICHQNRSLFGITWSHLRAQLDGVEMRSTYTLNPLAPEFVPRQMRQEMATSKSPSTSSTMAGANLNYSRMSYPPMQMNYPQMFFVPSMVQHPIVYPQPPNWKLKALSSPPQKGQPQPPPPQQQQQPPPPQQQQQLVRPPQPPYWSSPYPFQQAPPRVPVMANVRPPLHPPPPIQSQQPLPPAAAQRIVPERPNTQTPDGEAPKQFQFLQNVHFPERHSSPALNVGSWDTNQNVSSCMDFTKKHLSVKFC